MTWLFAIRTLALAMSGAAAAVAFVRSFDAPLRTQRWPLLAIAGWGTAIVYGQLSLLHDPISSRTVVLLVLSVPAVVFTYVFLRWGPPWEQIRDLQAENRRLKVQLTEARASSRRAESELQSHLTFKFVQPTEGESRDDD